MNFALKIRFFDSLFPSVTVGSPPRLRNAGAAVAEHVGKLMPVLARQASPEEWWLGRSSGDIKIVSFPMKSSDFPIENGDFPLKNGDFPMTNGEFSP